MKDCFELYDFWKKNCQKEEKKYCKDLINIINTCYRKHYSKTKNDSLQFYLFPCS